MVRFSTFSVTQDALNKRQSVNSLMELTIAGTIVGYHCKTARVRFDAHAYNRPNRRVYGCFIGDRDNA